MSSNESTKPLAQKKDDMNMIIPNLYLGSLEAAINVERLKELKITHILTVEDHPLEMAVQNEFTYKFKLLHDLPFSDVLEILEESIEFIDSALEKSGSILVHCLVGMSRSAAIVIGYLMAKQNKPFKEIFDFVKESRFIRPNSGFTNQLEFFEAMNFTVDRDSSNFRNFKLQKLAEQVKRGGRFEDLYSIENLTDDDEKLPCYKCKKCRFKLFTVKQIVTHAKSEWGKTDTICSQELFVEPLSWFQDKLGDLDGKLNCPNPKCATKLGAFDWCGTKCSCGTWACPAFHISPSKVDYFKFIDPMIFKNELRKSGTDSVVQST